MVKVLPELMWAVNDGTSEDSINRRSLLPSLAVCKAGRFASLENAGDKRVSRAPIHFFVSGLRVKHFIIDELIALDVLCEVNL